MSQNPTLSGLIPRGSLGLKLLLVCVLVLAMGIPLLTVGLILAEREQRANQVTAEIGDRAGGAQSVGGPMLLVPFERNVETTDAEGRVQTRVEHGNYIIFPETGVADATLTVTERQRGIYRAAVYRAETKLDAAFDPADVVDEIDPAYRLDWTGARIVMFVHDSRAVLDAAEVRFGDGSTATLEPLSGLDLAAPAPDPTYTRSPQDYTQVYGAALQAFAAPANLEGPTAFTVETNLVLGGAQRFAIAAFAQDTQATIRGNRRDVSLQGYFQSTDRPSARGDSFAVSWRVPYVARGVEKAVNLAGFSLSAVANRDMAVSFVAPNDIYQGVARAVRYSVLFIGIVFLATLIFEAVSGQKAHPAQYLLVGLAQCVFYLLLLSITELTGFTVAFVIAAAATIGLLAYYAGASFKSAATGVKSLFALAGLYGAMYVLMTLEDFALLAGSVVAFVVIAATMIATRRIDWYGRGARTAAAE